MGSGEWRVASGEWASGEWASGKGGQGDHGNQGDHGFAMVELWFFLIQSLMRGEE